MCISSITIDILSKQIDERHQHRLTYNRLVITLYACPFDRALFLYLSISPWVDLHFQPRIHLLRLKKQRK